MTEIMKIFEFCHAVMLDEKSKFNLPLLPSDFNELSLIAADTDFNIPRKRCAFMYRYGTCNMQFIVSCIVKFFTECQDAVSIVAHDMENINLCSLSIGPGIDNFAFLIAVEHSKLFANMPQFKHMKVITKYAAWRNTLKIMQKHVGTLCHYPLSQTDDENVEVLQGDIFQAINDRFQCVKEANIVMMVKTLNLTAPLLVDDKLSSNLVEVLNMMKPGSLLFCIDTKPSIAVLHRALAKLHGRLLYAPDHMTISLQPITFPVEFEKLYGCFPVVHARGCFIVWQKEIDFSLLEWPSGNVSEERLMSISGISCTSNRSELIANDRLSKSVISNESRDIENSCRPSSCTSNDKNSTASDYSDTLNETESIANINRSRFCSPRERERFANDWLANDWLANNWATNNWLENDCRSRYCTSNESEPIASSSNSYTPNKKGSVANDIPNERSADRAYFLPQQQIMTTDDNLLFRNNYKTVTNIEDKKHTSCGSNEQKDDKFEAKVLNNSKELTVDNDKNIESNHRGQNAAKEYHWSAKHTNIDKAIQTDPFRMAEKPNKNQSSVILSLTERVAQMASLLENFETKKITKSELDANCFKLNDSKCCLQNHSAEAIANSDHLRSRTHVPCCSCSHHLIKPKPISSCCPADLERSVNEDCCKSAFYKHCCHPCIRSETQQSKCMCLKHSVERGSRISSVSNNAVANVPSIVIPLQNLNAVDLSRILQMALAGSSSS